MTQLIKLEKRFESALEKLERAFAGKDVGQVTSGIEKKAEGRKENHINTDDLSTKISDLEKAAKSDADEIDKLVKKLKEILETHDD